MLTSNYLVVIQEEFNVKQGWILTYFPRKVVCGIQNQPRDLSNELAVQLSSGNQETEYKLLLAKETVDVWRRQWVQHGGQWQDLPVRRN